MQLILVLLLFLISGSAFACFVPPPSIVRDHATLIAEETTIAILEVRPDSSSPGTCLLKVARLIEGASPSLHGLKCRIAGEHDWMTDFGGHSEEGFWKHRGGRLGVNGDCSVIPPGFTIGKKYLALLGVAPDMKQFEQLADSNDRWLRFVEDEVCWRRHESEPFPSRAPTLW